MWLEKLRSRKSPDERVAERARILLARADDHRESGNTSGVGKSLEEATVLLRSLSNPTGQELRGLCCLWKAEVIVLTSTPRNIPKETIWTVQALCDQAEFEIRPLLEASQPLTEWNKWYRQSNPRYPIGLIEMCRGTILHFSSSHTDKERQLATTHYRTAVSLLDARSVHGKSVRELLSDVESSNAMAEQSRNLPPMSPDAQAFVKSLGDAAAKLEHERLQKDRGN